jgi:AcrR family transcriptional regulator
VGDAVRSPRERYREQVRDEIKAHAWAQVATTGAAALSLNAIARQMGISGPALYHYFANRDELITELVLDAYRDLAATCQDAVKPCDAPAARLAAVAGALRRWALDVPHRYLLIYGTPLPGYHAPPEATTLAATIMTILLDAYAEAADAEAEDTAPGHAGEAADALDHHIVRHRRWAESHPAPPDATRRALAFWTRLHGVLSLEVAGHFTGMEFDPALLYAAETEAVITMP